MAQVDLLFPFILRWEGGFVDDPADAGGATNKGVTLATWKRCGYDKNGDGVIDVDDLKLITDADVLHVILKPHYWDRWQADRIYSQKVADILVDWMWASGIYGIKIPQMVLKVQADGIVGEQTLSAVNEANPDALFDNIFNSRINFLNKITKNSIFSYERKIGRKATEEELLKYTNKRFLKGWLNRLNDLKNIQ